MTSLVFYYRVRNFYLMLFGFLVITGNYAQDLAKYNFKKFSQVDTLPPAHISQLILLNNSTFINIGVDEVNGKSELWYTYGRYIILQNSIYCRTHSGAVSNSVFNEVKSLFLKLANPYIPEGIESFKFAVYENYKFVIKNEQLIDEEERVYLPN